MVFTHAQTEFHRAYGSNGFDYGKEIIEMADSSLMVVGSTGISENSSDVYLLKVDSAGNFLWSTHFGGYLQESGEDFLLAKDSTFWICGYTNSQGSGTYDGYIAQTDINGQVLWDTAIGGSNWDFLYGIEELPDSSIVVCGETYSMGAGNNDIYVARLKNKQVLWERTIGSNLDDVGSDISLDAFGDLLITANSETGNGTTEGRLIKIDTLGNIMWDVYLNPGVESHLNRVKYRSGIYNVFIGSRYDTGTGFWEGWYGVVDSSGTLFIEHALPGLDDQYGRDISVYPSDNLVVGINFASQGVPEESDVVLYIMNGNGWYLWGNLSVNPLDDDLGGVTHCRDGGSAFAGTLYFDAQGGADVLIVKHDSIAGGNINIDNIYQDTLSIAEESINFSVFPSVFTDYFTVESEKELESLTLYNLEGKLVERITTTVFGQQINVNEGLPTGVYLLEIQWKNGQKRTVKICKN